MISKKQVKNGCKHTEEPLHTTKLDFRFGIADVLTTKQEEISPDYPDISTIPSGNEIYTQTVYDPTQTYVLYLAKNNKTVLWDRHNTQEIISIDNTTTDLPAWAPAGHSAVLVRFSDEFEKQEFYAISSLGTTKRLSYLTSLFSTTALTQYKWSPNGRYIAFWLNSTPSSLEKRHASGFSLAILDLETNQIVDYCLEGADSIKTGEFGGIISYPLFPPSWSPDSKALLIHMADGNQTGMAVILDVQQNYAAKIADDMIPMGWLIQEP